MVSEQRKVVGKVPCTRSPCTCTGTLVCISRQATYLQWFIHRWLSNLLVHMIAPPLQLFSDKMTASCRAADYCRADLQSLPAHVCSVGRRLIFFTAVFFWSKFGINLHLFYFIIPFFPFIFSGFLCESLVTARGHPCNISGWI